MPWRGAEHADDFPSLGWGLLDWFTENLPSPRDPSKPLLFTDEQAMHIVNWYRLDDKGRRVHRRGYARRAKGWGKSPLEAAKAIAEFAGPVRFGGWDASGEPVAIPWGCQNQPRAWVQIAALSEDQTDNTWSVIYYFLTENDAKAADALGIDAGLTRCFLRGQPGAKLEPVTSAAGSREGQPITYGVLDESHLMTPSNGGVKLARTIRRNVGKMNATSFETTNSYVIGEGSVAELSHTAVKTGTAGIFTDELEAPREIGGVKVNLEASDAVLLQALTVAYGDSWWVDKPRLVADMRDTSNTWEDSARFNLNWPQKNAVTSAKLPAVEWAETVTETHVEVSPGACVIAYDCTKDGGWTSVAIAGGTLSEPYVEVIKHDEGAGWLPEYLVEKVKRWKPTVVGCNGSGPAGDQVLAVLAAFAENGIDVDLFKQMTQVEFKQACGGFYSDVKTGKLKRPAGQGPLEVAAANAEADEDAVQGAAALQASVEDAAEKTVGKSWEWDRLHATVPISPLVAVTVARALLPVEPSMAYAGSFTDLNDDEWTEE